MIYAQGEVSMDPSDRVVLVTGAARGMGAATTRGLLKSGARVIGLDLSWGRIDEYWTSVTDSKKELEGSGDRFLAVEADITSDADLDRAYEAAINRFKTVDAMINNAALLQHHIFKPHGRVKVLDTTDADWERMFKVNLIGTLKVIRRFVRPMIEKRRGAIVNLISSGALESAVRPNSMEQPYMASKSAIGNMSMYLAHELREFNIAVNAVSPGHAEMTGWELVDEARKKANIPVPTSRQVPEHIVPLLMFLTSHDTTNGPTGTFIDTNQWNLHHGHGTPSSWLRENIKQDKLQ
jgi:NAD(P)-dependent dehydrogenase (short-subunit alcohol dehydrogenase family)